MGTAERRSREIENAVVELAEAALLSGRVGESFDALVIRIRADQVTVQIAEPAVRADIATVSFVRASDTQPAVVRNGSAVSFGSGEIRLGDAIRVRLIDADARKRVVTFEPVLEEGWVPK
jgi:exoribonuclease R